MGDTVYTGTIGRLTDQGTTVQFPQSVQLTPHEQAVVRGKLGSAIYAFFTISFTDNTSGRLLLARLNMGQTLSRAWQDELGMVAQVERIDPDNQCLIIKALADFVDEQRLAQTLSRVYRTLHGAPVEWRIVA